MSKATDLQFGESIREVFSPIFRDYGFELQGDSAWDGHGEYFVTAKKDDIALNFYLSVTPLSPDCYCTLAVALSGKLAQKAVSKNRKANTSFDVMSIAEALDPDYKRPQGKIQTTQDLKAILGEEKKCLLKYCQGVLSGDMLIWSKVVKHFAELR
jgi:hypothetical protein